jgi:hypothetical protein
MSRTSRCVQPSRRSYSRFTCTIIERCITRGHEQETVTAAPPADVAAAAAAAALAAAADAELPRVPVGLTTAWTQGGWCETTMTSVLEMGSCDRNASFLSRSWRANSLSPEEEPPRRRSRRGELERDRDRERERE